MCLSKNLGQITKSFFMVVETVFTFMLSLTLEAIPMDFIFDNVNNFFDIALKLVGAFAVIASMTPNDATTRSLIRL